MKPESICENCIHAKELTKITIVKDYGQAEKEYTFYRNVKEKAHYCKINTSFVPFILFKCPDFKKIIR